MAAFLKHIFSALLLLPLISIANFGQTIKILPDGTVVLDNRYRIIATRFDPSWKPISQHKLEPGTGYPQSSAESFELRGTFDQFRATEKVKATGENSFRYEMTLTALKDPVPCNLLFAGINLPLQKKVEIRIDGKTVPMSSAYSKHNVFNGKAKRITVSDPYGEFTITGQFHVFLTGKFIRGGKESYQLRILPEEKHPKNVKEWRLALDCQYEFSQYNVKSSPIDLSGIFNRSFRDDGKAPGWTGQGPEMDLRALKTGKHNFHSIRINTVDPDDNGGRSCLVLGQELGPEKAGLKITDFPKGSRYLYLLHASAWTPPTLLPVGTIVIRYADGTTEKQTVAAGRDCGNWYKPTNRPNAFPAWTGKVPSADTGLYLSAFPLKGKVEHLEFRRAHGEVVWMIAGAAFASGKARFPQQEQFVVKQGPEWLPIQFKGSTAKDSPLDFSSFRDLPAGKYGHVVINAEGHFVFEKAPEKRIRFFGPNLVGSANFLDRDAVEKFIQNAERLGYNTVRLHHFEEGLLNRKAADSLTINPKQMDKFHYFISRLKERGFYVCIDLYASRRLKSGDKIPEFDNTGEFSMKNLVCISPSAMRNWKEFARKVLTAKNPYTGLSLAEDPVLYSLNLVNENALVGVWNSVRTSRGAQKLYLREFEEYLRSHRLTADGKKTTRNGLFIEFLNRMQQQCIQEQMRFLKNEIKLKALITDLNNYTYFTLAGLRSRLDFVDNHDYWDHPSFPLLRWRVPFVFHNRSSISMDAATPRVLMPTRIFGKPFTVTEFNFCIPNVWRVELPSLFGGYAGLQDWDGLYRFAWSHGSTGMKNTNRPLNQFDIVNNIQAQMAERILYMLFLREDVKPAVPAYAFEFKPEQVRALKGNSRAGNFPDEFQRLGLFCRIGSLPRQMDLPGVKKVDPMQNNWKKSLSRKADDALTKLSQDGRITSSTGEISLNRNDKSLRVITPRSEVLTGAGTLSGKTVVSAKMSCYQTVALMSLDAKPLTESAKILLIQLTDLSNNGLSFEDKSRRVLLDWGTLPQMLERGSAELTLALPHKMRVVPLALDGTPSQRELSTEYRDGKQYFRIATDLLTGGTLSYLLTR